MKIWCFLPLFLVYSISIAGDSWLTVYPNNPHYYYSGRIDFQDPEAPAFCYPGVYIVLSFDGSSAEISMTELGGGDKTTSNYFEIILDDKPYTTWKLVPGINKLNVVTQKDLHVLKIFKRTECAVGKCVFNGIKLLQPAVVKKYTPHAKVIEFIGDSYTCGYGNVLSIQAPPSGNPNTGFSSENENNYMAWGAITARSLKMEYRCVAFSGRGLYRNNTGSSEGTLPELYTTINPDGSEEYIQPEKHPDYVVVHLGTNDFYLESQGNLVDSASFVKAYKKFLHKLRRTHPKAHLVVVVSNGLSDWWPKGTNSRTRCLQMLKAVLAEVNDSNSSLLDIGIQQAPYGEDWHPSIPTHQQMAEKLVEHIQKIEQP